MTNTIDQIRELKNQCFEHLEALRANDFENQTFGQEREFSAQNLIKATHELLTSVTAMTKSPAKFARNSNYSERSQINSGLNNLNSYLSQRNLQSVEATLRNLIPSVRNISWNFQKEFSGAYSEAADAVDNRMSELSSKTAEYEEIGQSIADKHLVIEQKETALSEQLQRLEEQNTELTSKLEELETKKTELQSIIDEEEEKSSQITELLSSSKANEAVVSSFSKRVEKRETQLEGQEGKTSEFMGRLETLEKNHRDTIKTMENEREQYLMQAQTLIESSKQALEFTTAEGLSAAFQARQETVNKQRPWLWLIASLGFLGAVIYLSLSLLSNEFKWQLAIVRLSLMPLLVAGVWFCAGQYVKIKNIAEDYAFKTTLAKSIVGFSDQLSNSDGKGEVYNQFMVSTMAQIHKDPLRKHSIKSQELETSNFRTEIQKQSAEISRLQKVISGLMPKEL